MRGATWGFGLVIRDYKMTKTRRNTKDFFFVFLGVFVSSRLGLRGGFRGRDEYLEMVAVAAAIFYCVI